MKNLSDAIPGFRFRRHELEVVKFTVIDRSIPGSKRTNLAHTCNQAHKSLETNDIQFANEFY